MAACEVKLYLTHVRAQVDVGRQDLSGSWLLSESHVTIIINCVHDFSVNRSTGDSPDRSKQPIDRTWNIKVSRYPCVVKVTFSKRCY
jgi:hypothetical protein